MYVLIAFLAGFVLATIFCSFLYWALLMTHIDAYGCVERNDGGKHE